MQRYFGAVLLLLGALPAFGQDFKLGEQDDSYSAPVTNEFVAPNEGAKELIPVLSGRSSNATNRITLSTGSERSFISFALNPAAAGLVIGDKEWNIIHHARISIKLFAATRGLKAYRHARFDAVATEWKAMGLTQEEFDWWKINVRENADFEFFHDQALAGSLFGESSFLTNEELCIRLQEAARAGQLNAVQIDFSKPEQVYALVDKLRRAGKVVDAFDLSNAWQNGNISIEGKLDLFQALAVVTDDNSIVVVTDNHSPYADQIFQNTRKNLIGWWRFHAIPSKKLASDPLAMIKYFNQKSLGSYGPNLQIHEWASKQADNISEYYGRNYYRSYNSEPLSVELYSYREAKAAFHSMIRRIQHFGKAGIDSGLVSEFASLMNAMNVTQYPIKLQYDSKNLEADIAALEPKQSVTKFASLAAQLILKVHPAAFRNHFKDVNPKTDLALAMNRLRDLYSMGLMNDIPFNMRAFDIHEAVYYAITLRPASVSFDGPHSSMRIGDPVWQLVTDNVKAQLMVRYGIYTNKATLGDPDPKNTAHNRASALAEIAALPEKYNPEIWSAEAWDWVNSLLGDDKNDSQRVKFDLFQALVKRQSFPPQAAAVVADMSSYAHYALELATGPLKGLSWSDKIWSSLGSTVGGGYSMGEERLAAMQAASDVQVWPEIFWKQIAKLDFKNDYYRSTHAKIGEIMKAHQGCPYDVWLTLPDNVRDGVVPQPKVRSSGWFSSNCEKDYSVQ